jgi:hypothetical protein
VVNSEESRFLHQIARYGLPSIIVVFYFTAATQFEYTPESTFLSFQYSGNTTSGNALSGIAGFASPVWMALVLIGGWFQLNGLLTVKILGLFFSCLVIMIAYLLAFEVLRDRLMAFCISLIVGMQAWFLQAGPSGSAFAIGLMLSLATLFFLLRNEYVLASILIGLCTLVFWQAVGLLLFLLADIWLNSIDKRRASKVMASAALIFLSVLLPWLLFAMLYGFPVVPMLVPLGEFTGITVWIGIALAVEVGLSTVGITFLMRSAVERKHIVRTQSAVWLWMLWLAFVGSVGMKELWLMAIPLFIMYAFFGLKRLLDAISRTHFVQPVMFALAGLLIALAQFEFHTVTRTAMENSIDQAQQEMSIAYWLKSTMPQDATIVADQPGRLGFYLGKAVSYPGRGATALADYVVTTASPIEGYEIAYVPVTLQPDKPGQIKGDLAVWSRK